MPVQMKMKAKEISSSTYQRIIQEIDFLDRKKPTKLIFFTTTPENCSPPALIIFPALFEPVKSSSSPEKSTETNDPHGVIISTDLTLGPDSKIAPSKNQYSSKKKSRPRKTNITAKQVQQQQQPCPMRTLQAIQNTGGSESEPVFLFQKILTASDVHFVLNRIFITGSEKLLEALGEDERRKVENENFDFRVLTVDPNGEGYELNITRWHCLRMIVLNHEWSKLVGANGLEVGDCVKGWGYRHGGGNFRLALDVIKERDELALRL